MRSIATLALVALVLPACREPDRPASPRDAAGLAVDSDPQGARILLNGSETGAVTPDTIRDLTVDQHRVDVVLDTGEFTYAGAANVQTSAEEIPSVLLPLLLRCVAPDCATSYHTPNRVRFAVGGQGALLLLEGGGEGAHWPASTGNSYVSTGAPVIAGIQRSTGDTLGLGPYDHRYLAGRPAPEVTPGASFSLAQSTWILPLAQVRDLRTIRGMQIEEEVLSEGTAPDAVVIRLTFRNITDRTAYTLVDPLAQGGITFDEVYVGLALDADVGDSTDDMVSYDPALDMAFLYDADFRELAFTTEWSARPGLVGLRVLEAPPGTSVRLNAWPRERDWQADGLRALVSNPGQPERTGWRWLSATQTVLPNHAHERIGYAPNTAADYRVSAAAGPLTLRPGDAATITLAVVFAEPEPGTFTSGTTLTPGDPADTGRPLHAVAAGLRREAEAAELMAGG